MFTLNCKGRMLVIETPLVMGIINTTPDSFYPGSRINSIGEILSKADQMITEGAAILDLGGQSTRPKSTLVSEEEELKRVLPAIEVIHQKFPQQIISIDTFYASVAKNCVEAGASIVNDISAGSMDKAMIDTIAQLGVPYVLTHLLETPQTMQENPFYKNVTLEVFDSLNFKMAELIKAGIHDVIIDPGFGFGKTSVHNFQLLDQLHFFTQMSKPIMVGLSRKATVYKTLGISSAEALNGSTVLHTIALMNGANILRVHDVKEAMQTVTLFTEFKKAKEQR